MVQFGTVWVQFGTVSYGFMHSLEKQIIPRFAPLENSAQQGGPTQTVCRWRRVGLVSARPCILCHLGTLKKGGCDQNKGGCDQNKPLCLGHCFIYDFTDKIDDPKK